MEGTIHGTAITVIDGEEHFQAFTLRFRSALVVLGESVCGL